MRLSPISLATAAAALLAAGPGLAAPGGMHAGGAMGSMPMTHPMGATSSHTPMGPTNGTGWNHMNGPTHTGQPNQSCGSASAPFTPGNAASAPGSAFDPTGKAGSVYAGQQPQNSRNTASVAQYDSACAHQR